MRKPETIKLTSMWALLVGALFIGIALGYWWRMTQMSDTLAEMKKAQAQIVQSLTDCEQLMTDEREKEK